MRNSDKRKMNESTKGGIVSKNMNPVKASIWYTVCSITQKGISLLLIPMYVRIMTTEEYGIYTLAQSWEGILLIFTTLNLAAYAFNNCLIQNENEREKVTSAFGGIIVTLTVVCICILGLFNNFWEHVFRLPGKLILLILLDSCFLVIIDLWYARKKFDYAYRGVALVTIGISVCNLIVGMVFVIYSPEKAFAAFLAGTGTRGVVAMLLLLDIWRKGHVYFDRKFWSYAFRFNIPLIPHFLSTRILQQADRVMIEKYCGASQAGIYGFSYKITEAMLIFNTAFLSSIIPWTYRNLKEKKYKDIFPHIFLTIILIAVLNAFLILLAPEVIAVLGTREYEEAKYVIPPVACSIFLMYLYNCFVNITYYYEENKKITMASIIAACLNIGLNLLMIPRYGYLAAGYTTLISYICLAIMHGVMQRSTLRKNGIREEVYSIRVLTLFSAGYILLGLCSNLLYKNWILRYSIMLVSVMMMIIKRNALIEVVKTILRGSNREKKETDNNKFLER